MVSPSGDLFQERRQTGSTTPFVSRCPTGSPSRSTSATSRPSTAASATTRRTTTTTPGSRRARRRCSTSAPTSAACSLLPRGHPGAGRPPRPTVARAVRRADPVAPDHRRRVHARDRVRSPHLRPHRLSFSRRYMPRVSGAMEGVVSIGQLPSAEMGHRSVVGLAEALVSPGGGGVARDASEDRPGVTRSGVPRLDAFARGDRSSWASRRWPTGSPWRRTTSSPTT